MCYFFTQNKRFLFIILLVTGTSNIFSFNNDNASLEHKNSNLRSYLDQISEELEEKTQLIKHIVAKSNGTYLDIGTGGDSIAHILHEIPSNIPVSLIASDIDESVLNLIKEKHPELNIFLDQKDENKVQLKLVRMDATNMKDMHDNSVDGVGASALIHELYSYVPAKTPLDQFFLELIRILKKDGVFIYRDPKWDDNYEQDSLVILKDPMAKIFTTLFLPRFLDRTFSKHVDFMGNCVKPSLYKNSHIRINFCNKTSNKTLKLGLEAFFQTPTTEIDFSRNISIEAPRGLISEIQRHYILFIKNIFITDLVDKEFFNKKILNLNNLPNQERTLLNYYLHAHAIENQTFETSLEIFQQILHEKKRLFSLIEKGIEIEIKDHSKVESWCSKLHKKGINKELLYLDSNKLWLDAKLLALIFNGTNSDIFADFSPKTHADLPLQVLEWLQREGEEFYFYKTTDELITYVGRLSKHYLSGTDRDGYILCPMSSSAIKVVSRNLYKSVAETHMPVLDIDGNKQDMIFDKNIIHFKLMQTGDALNVYKEITKTNKEKYPELTKWIDNEW